MKINIFVIIRFFLGCLFLVSGGEKLISPYQNFLYVVQSYQIFNAPLENATAHFVPWVEFILGVFLVFGLWLKWTLRGVMLMFSAFILIVGQALIRQLPIEECGCFGSLVVVPLHILFVFDSVCLLLTGLLLCRIKQVCHFSLDSHFSQK